MLTQIVQLLRRRERPRLSRPTPRGAGIALSVHDALGVVVWPAFVAGAVVLVVSFSYASTHTSGHRHFLLFWIGMFLIAVPAFLRLSAGRVPRAERLAIVAAFGLINYLPKYLRSPTFPLFHDEHAHAYESHVIASGGEPFVPNPIVPITEFFPGLHTLTVSLQQITGLGQTEINHGLLALLHAVALLGVFVVAETVFGSARIAGLAAFVYAINPSFMWFNSQYAYESLAIVFFIWAVVAFVQLEAVEAARSRRGWFVTGLLLAAGSIVTHHLSTYFLILVLLLGQAVLMLRARRGAVAAGAVRVSAAFTLSVTAAAGAWIVFIASGTVGYLAPHLGGALDELLRLIYREEESRVLFARSTAPGYEKVSAYLTPVIVGVAVLVGVRLLWTRRPRSTAPFALAVLGLGFFASLPVMLTELGVEGAVRTWAFSYLGLAVVVAPAITLALGEHAAGRQLRSQGLAAAAVTVAMGIVLIGNVTMHMNVEYRFPGNFVYGSDTRSLTRELIGTSRWFRQTYGTGHSILTDRYSGLALVSFGEQWWIRPSPTFPVWDVLLKAEPPERELLDAVRNAGVRYLVVDDRMARFLPRVGAYFLPHGGEPGADPVVRPVARAALSKFERLPWTIKVYESDHLAVYRIDYQAVDLDGAAASRRTKG